MDVGLGPTIRYHRDDPRPLVEVYDEFFDEFLLGDELGYSHIWLPEHHFADDAHSPSALPLLAALARQTRQARLGTYILLLAFHNPILVAEDAAVVDILSHGRFDLGIGAGPDAEECDAFGVPPSECYARTYEALQVIERCWTEEEFSHHGKYFHYDNVRVTTKPVQQPHPPIYLAARGPQSATRSAKRGNRCWQLRNILSIYDAAYARSPKCSMPTCSPRTAGSPVLRAVRAVSRSSSTSTADGARWTSPALMAQSTHGTEYRAMSASSA